MTTYPDYTQGYTCTVCGQWVPYNTLHTCPGTPRLLAVLERIATALEKRA
jgi:hypothetical protein